MVYAASFQVRYCSVLTIHAAADDIADEDQLETCSHHPNHPILINMFLFHRAKRIVSFFIVAFSFLWLYRLCYRDTFQHRYNQFSCPGYITTPISIPIKTNRTASRPFSVHESDHVVPPDFSLSPFAYVFYATDIFYACSVLVNIDRLNNLFNTTHRIIVLVKPDLDSHYLTAFTAQNATVIPYEPPPLANDSANYYHDVLLKLVAFRLHHYIPSLRRILVLDADQIILQSLDHVFNLPAVDVASPRAYWQDSNGVAITSAFLLVSLSDRLWDKMSASLETIGSDIYDMDLVNKLFNRTLLILPGDYATLNSHWETNDIPVWWQGTVPKEVYTWQRPAAPPEKPSEIQEPPPPQQPPSQQLSQNSNWNGTTNQTSIDNVNPPVVKARDLEDIEMEEKQKVFKAVLHEVYADVKVLHYTALGKPWVWHEADIGEARPFAHELFKEQFRTWQQAAMRLCADLST